MKKNGNYEHEGKEVIGRKGIKAMVVINQNMNSI